MDLDTFDQLLSPVGRKALAAATDLNPMPSTILGHTERLRKHFPAPLVRAALDTAALRLLAAAKFHHADGMFFTREALEVASGEVVSNYRAERFARFDTVGDFGCGIGADAVALAAAGCKVEAVDRDPMRCRMAEVNADVCGVADRVRVRCADLLTDPLPPVDAAFADPGRRADGKRFLSLGDYSPPPADLFARLPAGLPAAFKLAPGVNRDELATFDGEAEFISVNGELKECALWLGELKAATRRATLLKSALTDCSSVGNLLSSPPLSKGGPGGVVGPDPPPPAPPWKGGKKKAPSGSHTLAADETPAFDEIRPVGAYLYDADAAVVRAELVPTLGAMIGGGPIDGIVQWLTSDAITLTPFATAYRVDVVLPFDRKTVLAALRERTVGRVTVVNRGSKADVRAWAEMGKLPGDGHRFLLLTRAGGKQVAILAERV